MWNIEVVMDASCANGTEAAMLALAIENGCSYNIVSHVFDCQNQDRLLRVYAMLVAMDLTIKKVTYATI